MSILVSVPPSAEPIDVSTVKLRLRVDGTAHDAMLADLIKTAREMAEHETGRALAPQTIDVLLDAFPQDGILIERVPVVGLTEIVYANAANQQTSLALADVVLEQAEYQIALVRLAVGKSWPATYPKSNAVRLRYTAGYAIGNCPASIVTWMIAQVGAMLRTPEAASDRQAFRTDYLESLLDQWRLYT